MGEGTDEMSPLDVLLSAPAPCTPSPSDFPPPMAPSLDRLLSAPVSPHDWEGRSSSSSPAPTASPTATTGLSTTSTRTSGSPTISSSTPKPLKRKSAIKYPLDLSSMVAPAGSESPLPASDPVIPRTVLRAIRHHRTTIPLLFSLLSSGGPHAPIKLTLPLSFDAYLEIEKLLSHGRWAQDASTEYDLDIVRAWCQKVLRDDEKLEVNQVLNGTNANNDTDAARFKAFGRFMTMELAYMRSHHRSIDMGRESQLLQPLSRKVDVLEANAAYFDEQIGKHFRQLCEELAHTQWRLRTLEKMSGVKLEDTDPAF